MGERREAARKGKGTLKVVTFSKFLQAVLGTLTIRTSFPKTLFYKCVALFLPSTSASDTIVNHYHQRSHGVAEPRSGIKILVKT